GRADRHCATVPATSGRLLPFCGVHVLRESYRQGPNAKEGDADLQQGAATPEPRDPPTAHSAFRLRAPRIPDDAPCPGSLPLRDSEQRDGISKGGGAVCVRSVVSRARDRSADV